MRLVLVLLCVGGLAAADESVVRVGRADLGGLVWLATGSCGTEPLWRRQCQALRAARTAALRGKTFVARGDAGALATEAGTVIVRGCLACVEPVAGMYVTTRGSVAPGTAGVVGPELERSARPMPAGAHVDIYFTLEHAGTWTQGGARGLLVDATRWSVEPGPATSAAPVASAPRAPEQPTPEQIKTAMDAVAPEVAACYDRYGVAGTADVALEIDGDGTIAYAGVRGAFADTPTGACVAAAVKKARLPRFTRAPMKLTVPFLLR